MANLSQIYEWFMTGKKPTQAQFWATFGSFRHKEETIPQSAISNLTTVLNAKTENDQFNAHKVAVDAHADLFEGKQSVDQKGVAGGYVPLNEFSKIAFEFLSIVNNLTTGGTTSLLSAEQGVVLQTQIDAINTLLTSNDINLDTVQEIVDAIKTVETSLETILVNDLTTGGTTKALTAEMGKILKGLIDQKLSASSLKTINGNSLVGAGDITITGGAGSSIKVYNVKDYGVLGDGATDDTAKIQDTINACFAAGGGTVYFPNGVYLINGPVDSNSNSQIYFPLNTYTNSAELTTIKLLGETAPNQFSNPFASSGSNTPSQKGVILKSNLLSAGNVIGTRSENVIWGNFNFLHAQIENVCVRVRSMTSTTNVASQATGIDLRKIAYFNADNVEVSPTSNHNLIVEPANTAYGIRFPQTNNFCFSNAINTIVLGMYVGFDTYEHCSLDKCFSDVCVNGLVLNQTNHSIHVGKMIIARCRYNIKSLSNSYFYINNVSFEDDYLKDLPSPTWNATVFDLLDESLGTANGIIRFHNVRAGFGVDYSKTKRNRVNANIKFVKINELTEFMFLTDPYSPPTTNLLAYWKFEESTGNYIDSSGNGRTATRVNGATSGAGRIGNSMITVNTSNQYANAGSVGLSYDNNALTICGWFKINSSSSQPYQTLFNKGDAAGREYSLYYQKGGNIFFQVFNGTTLIAVVPKAPPLNTFFFVCAELIGNQLKLDINNGGTPNVAPAIGVSQATSKDFMIGAGSSAGESLDGAVDELSVWNRELNADEKTYLFNYGGGNSIVI